MRGLKYLLLNVLFIPGMIGLYLGGIWSWLLPAEVFIFIPFLEILLPQSDKNLDAAAEESALQNRLYDWVLYLSIPFHTAMLVYFLMTINAAGQETYAVIGKILTMGLSCGVMGINVAHELGHRPKKYEQWMAKFLLLTSLYMHFFIEHNRGHHKHVSTEEDPASARRNEPVYFFWVRSVVTGYYSAWKLEAERLRKKSHSPFSLRNEMLQFQIIQAAALGGIYWAFGPNVLLAFTAAAVIGFLLLETVNYIEHYGLRRKKTDNGNYARVQPVHSWNSNHTVGRLVLFELTRHSDHHYKAARKYQVLRHFDHSPQLPTGYPGMILLSLAPPLFFWLMHRQIDRFREAEPEAAAQLG